MNEKAAVYRGNILVVDDILENVKFLVRMLGEQGYRVRPCLNGNLALTAARKETPDLILLDIMMPGMDGYQVAAQLKQDPLLSQVPIIFISALDNVHDKVKSFSAGGVDYVTKPFQTEELLARIETHLTLQQLRRDLKDRNDHLEAMNKKLQQAVDEIKTLQGILPICSFCKKIRDDGGYWQRVEVYFNRHTLVDFSHGVCPDCAREHYPDLDLSKE